jgi:hypothetical protein
LQGYDSVTGCKRLIACSWFADVFLALLHWLPSSVGTHCGLVLEAIQTMLHLQFPPFAWMLTFIPKELSFVSSKQFYPITA